MLLRSFAVLLILFFGKLLSVQAQNLVPNPGFEEFVNCPGSLSHSPAEFNIPYWKGIGLATPDYFNACGKGEADVPYNWAGVSDAFDGKGFAGVYAYMNTADTNRYLNNYREYVQTTLLQPLIKDSSYILEFHYKLSSYSMYSIDRMGMLLTDTALNIKHDHALNIEPTLSVVQDSALTRTTGLWETARMDYKAKGGERFLVIGNFFPWESTKSYKIRFRAIAEPLLAEAAYYYIDDVKVIPKNIGGEQLLTQLIPEFSTENIKAGKSYVLKNIQFEFNSYKLTESSFPELDKLADYLSRNSSIYIQVHGHTDDQGTEVYNSKLSRDRAQSVARYLSSKGIKSHRIEAFGHGKNSPLINATSEEARKTNRRVEIQFLD